MWNNPAQSEVYDRFRVSGIENVASELALPTILALLRIISSHGPLASDVLSPTSCGICKLD